MWLEMLTIALFITLSYYFYESLTYWDKKAVKYARPIPIFGNMLDFAIKRRSRAEVLERIYKRYPNIRYVGFYNFGTPALMIKDPQLIKTLMVKEFNTFPEHKYSLPSDVDPMWNNNLLVMKGDQKWRDLRSTLSGFFTASRMKAMYVLMKEYSHQFVQYFLSQCDETIEIELKDVFGRFANDVIANMTFGVTCDSLYNPENDIYRASQMLTSSTGIQQLSFLISTLSPTFSKITRIRAIPKEVTDLFTYLVKEAIKLREEQKITRPDMLNLLIQSRKESLKNEDVGNEQETGFLAEKESDHNKETKKVYLTDEVITAQVILFFFGGFDTISTMITYMIYELAINPEVQEKFRNEVDDAFERADGDITYDTLMQMKYLDMLVSETLRKWPPFIDIDRVSVKPYVIKAQCSEEVDIHLQTSTWFNIPIYAIHRDPKYYPNPMRFDPERFSQKNKLNIDPYTYLPFGMGPRNCIASRFALMEAKLVAVEIVSHFEILVTRKTQNPIVVGNKNFTSLPDEAIWVGLRKRNK